MMVVVVVVRRNEKDHIQLFNTFPMRNHSNVRFVFSDFIHWKNFKAITWPNT